MTRYVALTTFGLGLLVLAIAVMVLGVRELAAIGSCASDPVFVSLRPCPDSVAPLIILVSSLPFLGAIGWGLYVLRVDRRSPSAWSEGPEWSLWWWPALFFALGWQFVEMGQEFAATDRMGSAIAMWGVTATFALMAAVPLLFTRRALLRHLFGGPRPAGWSSLLERVSAGVANAAGVAGATQAGGPWPSGAPWPSGVPGAPGTGTTGARHTGDARPIEVAVRVADALTFGVGRTMAGAVVAAAERRAAAQSDVPDDAGAGAGGAGAAGAGAGASDGLAGALERLAALHAAGHLTEAEFSAAKAQVLRQARSEGR